MAKLKLNPLFILWHVLRNDIHRLEYDPKTQWKFHLWMTRYWVCNFPIIIYLFFYQSRLWVAIALFINTVYSLYANLATDFGAVPSAYAAMKAQEMTEGSGITTTPIFANPGYRPPDKALIAAVVQPAAPSKAEAMPDSKGLGWNDMDSAGMEALAADDFLL